MKCCSHRELPAEQSPFRRMISIILEISSLQLSQIDSKNYDSAHFGTSISILEV